MLKHKNKFTLANAISVS